MRKKNMVALFEVISKAREKRQKAGLDVPTWMRGPGHGEAPAATEPPAGIEPATAPEPPAPPASPSPAAQPSFPHYAEPLVSTEDGRLRLSLNYTHCTIVCVATLLVMAGVFALGRASVRGKAASEPTASLVPGPGAEEGPVSIGPEAHPPVPSGTSPERVEGKYYLVIQGPGARVERSLQESEARKIVAFCNANGMPASYGIYENRYYVIAEQPFDYSQIFPKRSAEVLKFAEDIERLGRKYRSQGGDYTFMQRTKATEELNPMFIRFKRP